MPEELEGVVFGEQGQGEGQSPEGEAQPNSERGAQSSSGTVPAQHVPYSRFKEVNDSLRSYKELGDAASIKEALARLKEIQEGNGPIFTEKEATRLKSELFAVLPQLRLLERMNPQMVDGMLMDMQTRQEAIVMQSQSKVPSYLKEMGWEVNDKNSQRLENTLSGIIEEDPKLLKRFRAGDLSVVDVAWKELRSTWFAKSRLATAGQVQQLKQSGPKPVASSAIRKEEKPGRVKTEAEILADAADEAWPIIAASE